MRQKVANNKHSTSILVILSFNQICDKILCFLCKIFSNVFNQKSLKLRITTAL
jgi:hypothetical protein